MLTPRPSPSPLRPPAAQPQISRHHEHLVSQFIVSQWQTDLLVRWADIKTWTCLLLANSAKMYLKHCLSQLVQLVQMVDFNCVVVVCLEWCNWTNWNFSGNPIYFIGPFTGCVRIILQMAYLIPLSRRFHMSFLKNQPRESVLLSVRVLMLFVQSSEIY